MYQLAGRYIRSSVAGNVEKSLEMLRRILTGPSAMSAKEREQVEEWAKRIGSSFDEWELSMASNMSRSVLYTLDGYNNVPKMLNSDWGFRLEDIAIAPQKKTQVLFSIPTTLPPVVIVGAIEDTLAPVGMQRFVADAIPGAQLIELHGNHISVITSLQDIFSAMFLGLIENENPVL